MQNSDVTEKITVNVNTVDLGMIDLLVSEGYYATRTEFIKTAIKARLDGHSEDTKQVIARKSGSSNEWSVGIGEYTKKTLQFSLKNGMPKKKVTFVGMLIIPDDVPMELLDETIESIKVYGVCRCRKEIKEKYKL